MIEEVESDFPLGQVSFEHRGVGKMPERSGGCKILVFTETVIISLNPSSHICAVLLHAPDLQF